jgi:AraC family transcriptional regulator
LRSDGSQIEDADHGPSHECQVLRAAINGGIGQAVGADWSTFLIMRAETAQAHRYRVVQALAYIESHLDEALSVPELARRFGFSPTHFQRVFRQQAGESPYRYVQRLRLERAAFRLKRTSEAVTELAFASGYRAHEAFTRAFQAEFGASPQAFRGSQPWSVGRMAGPAEIVHVPRRRIAFVRHVGPYAEAGKVFAALRAWAEPRGLLRGASVVGMPLDHKRVTKPERLRYDVGIVLDASVTDTRGIAVRQLRGGRYVRVRHQGTYEELDHTYDFIYAQWLPSKRLSSPNLPPFEVYLDSPAVTPAERCRTDVYVPLSARME